MGAGGPGSCQEGFFLPAGGCVFDIFELQEISLFRFKSAQFSKITAKTTQDVKINLSQEAILVLAAAYRQLQEITKKLEQAAQKMPL